MRRLIWVFVGRTFLCILPHALAGILGMWCQTYLYSCDTSPFAWVPSVCSFIFITGIDPFTDSLFNVYSFILVFVSKPSIFLFHLEFHRYKITKIPFFFRFAKRSHNSCIFLVYSSCHWWVMYSVWCWQTEIASILLSRASWIVHGSIIFQVEWLFHT